MDKQQSEHQPAESAGAAVEAPGRQTSDNGTDEDVNFFSGNGRVSGVAGERAGQSQG